VRRQVAVFKVAESDGLARRRWHRRPDLRWLAVVLDERDDIGSLRQYDQPLLQPHEQVIYLSGFRLGLALLDFTNGKAVEFSAMAEQPPAAATP
jgi:hypothetical protein